MYIVSSTHPRSNHDDPITPRSAPNSSRVGSISQPYAPVHLRQHDITDEELSPVKHKASLNSSDREQGENDDYSINSDDTPPQTSPHDDLNDDNKQAANLYFFFQGERSPSGKTPHPGMVVSAADVETYQIPTSAKPQTQVSEGNEDEYEQHSETSTQMSSSRSRVGGNDHDNDSERNTIYDPLGDLAREFDLNLEEEHLLDMGLVSLGLSGLLGLRRVY